jgi:hypothetical protein
MLSECEVGSRRSFATGSAAATLAAVRKFFNSSQVAFAFLFISLRWVPPMRWVERLTSRLITATQIRLAVAVALALAATNFFYLGVTTTRTAQVSESVNSTDSTTDDEIDVRNSASWQCAGVPIAVRCPPSALASPGTLQLQTASGVRRRQLVHID